MKNSRPNIAKDFMLLTESMTLLFHHKKTLLCFLILVGFSCYTQAQESRLKSIKPTKVDSLIIVSVDVNMDGYLDELELCLNSKEVRLCYYENNESNGFKEPSNLGTVKVKDHIGYRITSDTKKPYSSILIGTTNTKHHFLHEISLNSAALFHVRKATTAIVGIRD